MIGIRNIPICFVLWILTAFPVAAEIGWTSIRSTVGGARNIDISPSDPARWFAASSDGFFSTTDEGYHWSSTSQNFRFNIIKSSIHDPCVVYAGGYSFYISVSTDCGSTWIPFDITVNPGRAHGFFSVCENQSMPGECFFGGQFGIYRLFKSGGTWQDPERILPIAYDSGTIYSMIMMPGDPDTIYVARKNFGVFRLHRDGSAWTQAGEASFPEPGVQAQVLCADPLHAGTLYCGLSNGHVYRSTTELTSWEQLPDPPAESNAVTALLCCEYGDGGLKAAWKGHVCRYADGKWTDMGIPLPSSCYLFSIEELPVSGDLVVGTSLGCYVWNRDPGVWQARNRGIGNIDIMCFEFNPVDQQNILAGAYLQGVFMTLDGGLTWISSNRGLTDLTVLDIARSKTNGQLVFAVTTDQLARSQDGGFTWESCKDAGSNPIAFGFRVVESNPYQAADMFFAGAISQNSADTDGVYRSTDEGATWLRMATDRPSEEKITVHSFAFNPGHPDWVFAGAEIMEDNSGLLLRSTDGGASFATWSPPGITLDDGYIPFQMIVDSQTGANMWIAVSWAGIFRSTDGGGSFTAGQNSSGYYWRYLTHDSHDPATLYAGAGQFQKPEPEGVLQTTDSGATWHWNPLFTHDLRTGVVAADPSRNRVLAAQPVSGIHVTTDQGQTWSQLSRYFIQLPYHVNDVAVDPENPDILYVATEGNGVWKSVDSGWSWNAVNDGLPEDYRLVRCLDIDRRDTEHLVLGCAGTDGTDHRVYETNNAAGEWQRIGVSTEFGASIVDMKIIDAPVSSRDIWLATYGRGPFRSTDNGLTWTNETMDPSPAGLLLTSVTNTDYTNANDEPWIFVSSHGGGGSFIWRSETGIFQESGVGLPGDPADRDVNFIEADPERYGVFWAGTPSGLYMSADFGASWRAAYEHGPYPQEGIVPRDSGLIFAKREIIYFHRESGVVRSHSGFEWESLDSRLETDDLERMSCLAVAGAGDSARLIAGCGRDLEQEPPDRKHLEYPLKGSEPEFTLQMGTYSLHPGDVFVLNAVLNNPGSTGYTQLPMAVVLDIYGYYFFYPGWTQEFSPDYVDLPPGEKTIELLRFDWPEMESYELGLSFYGAFLTPDMQNILGSWDWIAFGW